MHQANQRKRLGDDDGMHEDIMMNDNASTCTRHLDNPDQNLFPRCISLFFSSK